MISIRLNKINVLFLIQIVFHKTVNRQVRGWKCFISSELSKTDGMEYSEINIEVNKSSFYVKTVSVLD